MLNKDAQTAIILGAGASAEYGFPVGDKLLSHLIDDNHHHDYINALKRILFNNADIFRAKNLFGQLPPFVVQHINADPHVLIRFADGQFTKWVEELHHVESIDQYIYYRPDNSILARLCVLLSLSKFENTEPFGHQHIESKGKMMRGTIPNWYKRLWTNILSLRPKDSNELRAILATFQFITFNYDRSLEFYLMKSIKSLFPASDIRVEELPIFHVYGQLGSLNSADKQYNPYKPIKYTELFLPDGKSLQYRLENDSHNAVTFKANDEKLLALAMEIKTYTQVYDSDKAAEIRAILQKVKSTLVFGYSYQAQNNDILWQGKYEGTFDSTSYWLGQDTCDRMSGFLKSLYSSVDPQLFANARKNAKVLDYLNDKNVPLYWPPK